MTGPGRLAPLAGIRVVEHARGMMGAFCGRLFADLGAQVTAFEPPGAVLRNEPPFLEGESLLHRHPAAGKRAGNRETRGAALAEADVFIDDTWPDVPDPSFEIDDLGRRYPRLTVISLSPFGRTGPLASWRGGELIGVAYGGIAYVTGRGGREPLKLAGHPFECLAATHGLIGGLGALWDRERSGLGRLVDVSLAETVASNQEFSALYTFLGLVRRRSDLPVPFYWGHTIVPCADGYLNFGTPSVRLAETIALWLGDETVRDDPRFASLVAMGLHHHEVEAIVRGGIAGREREELFEFGMALRLLTGPVATPDQVLASPQLAARDFWQSLQTGDGRAIPAPGSPVRLVAGAAAGPRPLPPPTGPRPLSGIRVIDFTLAYSGPTAGKILAELGADVVRVSSIQYPSRAAEIPIWPENDPGLDPWNRNGYYTDRYLGKREVTLDLTNPKGRALFDRLLETADVLLENHSPRALNNLGLSYDVVGARFPHLVMASISAFGQRGPWANYAGMGDTVEALGGMSDATGYHGGPPERSGMTYLDPISGAFGAAGIVAGLWRRARTGLGCYVDNAMYEAAVATFPEPVLAAAAGLPAPPRDGNHHPGFAPHNVYACAGDDQWIAIAVESDAAYQALRDALRLPDDPRFQTNPGRLGAQPALDVLIGAAVAGCDKRELAARLQAAGVAAAPVQDMRETFLDEHLRARGLLQEVEHPFGVRTWFRQIPGTIGGIDLSITRRSPLLGEHNREILQAELGVSDVEFDELWAEEVIGDHPVAAWHPPVVDLTRLDRYEGMREFDPAYRERQRL